MKHIFFLFLFFTLYTNAQQKEAQVKKSTVTFHSTLQGGILKGETSNAFQLLHINGMQYKTWFGGIGVGIDQYFMRTVPIFAEVRKDIFNKRTTPFVYAGIGPQITWLKEQEKIQYGNGDYGSGIYYRIGAGYKLGISNKHALIIEAGYSLKKVNYTYSYVNPCLVAPCPEFKNNLDYTLRRLSFQLGFIF